MSDQCFLNLKERLKGTYKGQTLENKAANLEMEFGNLLEEAKNQGVDPSEFLRKRVEQNKMNVQMEAKQRLKQIEANNKVLEHINTNRKTLKSDRQAIESLLIQLPGARYSSEFPGAERMTTGVAQRKSALLLGKLDELGIIKQAREGVYDDVVYRLKHGTISQEEMGKIPKEALAYFELLKKNNLLDYQLKTQAGANVGFKEGRLYRQHHNPENMQRMGAGRWVDIAKNSFRKSAVSMLENEDVVGKKLAKLYRDNPELAIDSFFREQYDKIMKREFENNKRGINVSDDLSEIAFGPSRTKSMEKSRKFEFDSPEAELEYNKTVNGQTLLGMVSRDVNSSSSHIAMMRIFGPNPRAGFKKAMDSANLGESDRKLLEKTFDLVSSNISQQPTSLAGKAFKTLRSFTDAALLKDVLLSTTTDIGFAGFISNKTGKNFFTSSVGSVFEGIKTLPPSKSRKAAARIGVLADQMLFQIQRNKLSGEMDFNMTYNPLDELSAIGEFRDGNIKQSASIFAEKALDKVDRFSKGMTRLTGVGAQSNAIRLGTSSVVNMSAADNLSKATSFDKLNPDLQLNFERMGIREAEFNGLKKAIDEDGMITFDSIDNLNMKDFDFNTEAEFINFKNDLGIKYSAFLTESAESVAPHGGIKNRRHFISSEGPDSVNGIILATVRQYKSFAMAVADTMKDAYGPEWNKNRMANLSYGVMTSMSLAYMVMQAKSMQKGEEPKAITEFGPKDYRELIIRSGFLGMAGDIFLQDYDENYISLAGNLAGPSVSTAEGLIRMGSSTIAAVTADESTAEGKRKAQKEKRNALRHAERFTPSLPFVKSLTIKKVYDDIHRYLNTGAKR